MIPDQIIGLRHELHRYPELSNREFETKRRISSYMQQLKPDREIELGETGLAYVFDGIERGKTVVYRAELDALPIGEVAGLPYSSVNQNISHSCGHDGHMAILAGLGRKISDNRPERGRVVLLFQPAEEVEQGAREVVNNPAFIDLNPDFIFAMHNIPGIKKHTIILKDGTMAAASRGLTVKLIGKQSHASEPESAITPVNAIALTINELDRMIKDKTGFSDMVLLTIIHIRMGDVSFGTTPGYAEIMITFRAFKDDDMELLCRKTEAIISRIAGQEGLRYSFEYCEVFPAVVNNPIATDLVFQAAKEIGSEISEPETPFRFSEDFSYFLQKYPGCFFGIGAGEDHFNLHNPAYNFPDDIIDPAIELFYNIYSKINL